MATKKPTKPAAKTTQSKAKDLKPKKDAKGGLHVRKAGGVPIEY